MTQRAPWIDPFATSAQAEVLNRMHDAPPKVPHLGRRLIYAQCAVCTATYVDPSDVRPFVAERCPVCRGNAQDAAALEDSLNHMICGLEKGHLSDQHAPVDQRRPVAERVADLRQIRAMQAVLGETPLTRRLGELKIVLTNADTIAYEAGRHSECWAKDPPNGG